MIITEFDQSALHLINKDIKAALENVAKLYGVSFKMGNIRYNGSNFNAKFEMAVIGESGQAVTKIATDFERYKKAKGINAEVGDLLVIRGERFEVQGYKAGASKYPIIIKSLDKGGTYKISVSQLNMSVL